MNKPALTRMWEAFLPVMVTPTVPEGAALSVAVLRHVRQELLPLLRRLEAEGTIDWYSFLLHGHPADPNRVALHLRATFTPEFMSRIGPSDAVGPSHLYAVGLPHEWLQARAIVPPACQDIAGLDKAALVGGDIARAWWLIGEQAAWLLHLVESHDQKMGEIPLLMHIVQFLHYLHNMTVVPDGIPEWFRSKRPYAYWWRLWFAVKGLWRALWGKR